jgi:uncharacterized membrane protein
MEIDKTSREDEKMRRDKIALAKLLLPFCLFSAAWLILFLMGPEIFTKFVTVWGIYTFSPAANALIVIPAGLGLGIHPVALLTFLVVDDAVFSLFFIWNFDYAQKLPAIGKYVEKAMRGGEEKLKKYKWLEGLGFIGLFAFVMFPLLPSGAIWGSILGRLMGMKSLMTFFAVVFGSFTRFAIEILIFM